MDKAIYVPDKPAVWNFTSHIPLLTLPYLTHVLSAWVGKHLVHQTIELVIRYTLFFSWFLLKQLCTAFRWGIYWQNCAVVPRIIGKVLIGKRLVDQLVVTKEQHIQFVMYFWCFRSSIIKTAISFIWIGNICDTLISIASQ
jgi:hypothetical protein